MKTRACARTTSPRPIGWAILIGPGGCGRRRRSARQGFVAALLGAIGPIAVVLAFVAQVLTQLVAPHSRIWDCSRRTVSASSGLGVQLGGRSPRRRRYSSI